MFEDDDVYDDFGNPIDDYLDFCDPFPYEDGDNYYYHSEDHDSSSNPIEDYEDICIPLEDIDVDIEAFEEKGEEVSRAMLKLPLDIFLDILSRLPIKSLARCRPVCKTWRKIVHHPRFTSMHHNKSIQLHNSGDHDSSSSILLHDRYYEHKLLMLDHDYNLENVTITEPQLCPSNMKVEVVGSCHGLLCLSEKSYHDPIYVCNPVIGEYMKLPKTTERMNGDFVSGFGYDQTTNVYKVVRMMFDFIHYESGRISSFKSKAEIYTLGSGMWRQLGDVSWPLCKPSQSSVYVNGALHWITHNYISLKDSELIISFDVSKEEFRAVQSPPPFSYHSKAPNYELGDLRRCLCLFDCSYNDQLELWIMKDYGVKGSWRKEYVIYRQELGLDRLCLYPLKMLDNGQMLLQHYDDALVCYDPKQRGIKRRSLKQFGSPFLPMPIKFLAITHVGSFVSLKDIIGPTTSNRSVNNRRWYKALYPLPIHNPNLDMENSIPDDEVKNLAAIQTL